MFQGLHSQTGPPVLLNATDKCYPPQFTTEGTEVWKAQSGQAVFQPSPT